MIYKKKLYLGASDFATILNCKCFYNSFCEFLSKKSFNVPRCYYMEKLAQDKQQLIYAGLFMEKYVYSMVKPILKGCEDFRPKTIFLDHNKITLLSQIDLIGTNTLKNKEEIIEIKCTSKTKANFLFYDSWKYQVFLQMLLSESTLAYVVVAHESTMLRKTYDVSIYKITVDKNITLKDLDTVLEHIYRIIMLIRKDNTFSFYKEIINIKDILKNIEGVFINKYLCKQFYDDVLELKNKLDNNIYIDFALSTKTNISLTLQ
jgi:hypothetical protein